MSTAPTILIVPGLRGHVPEHWQSLLAKSLPRVRIVPPMEGDGRHSRVARVDAVDAELAAIDGPVVVVAHSAGVMMMAHWAARPGPRRPLLGALLATPADVASPFPAGYPTTEELAAHGWLPIPRAAFGFPTLLAASRNDPLCAFDRARAFARDWGSELVDLGDVGHLNPASGYGPWPRAVELLQRLDAPSPVPADAREAQPTEPASANAVVADQASGKR